MTATAGGEVQLSLTQTQLIWRDFKRHRAALAGGIIIALLYLMALGAEFIAPYDPYHREMRSPLVPPMRVHLRDAEGRVRSLRLRVATEARPGDLQPVLRAADRSSAIASGCWYAATSTGCGI